MAKVSKVGGPLGGFQLEVFRKIFSLRRLERPSGWCIVVIWARPVWRLGVEVQEEGGISLDTGVDLGFFSSPNLWKKNFFLQMEWSLSKSFLISPISGSPGVGQKPFSRERTLSLSVLSKRSLRLTTLIGTGVWPVVTLVLNSFTISGVSLALGQFTLFWLELCLARCSSF